MEPVQLTVVWLDVLCTSMVELDGSRDATVPATPGGADGVADRDPAAAAEDVEVGLPPPPQAASATPPATAIAATATPR